MNILIFSEAAWDNKNSFGNTVSNFFDGDSWKEDRFYHFYCRNQIPDNGLQIDYYNLSAVDILRGLLKDKILGRRFSTKDLAQQKKALDETHKSEQQNIDRLHQKPNHFIYWAHEVVWLSRLWLNQDFKAFLSDSNPDVLFACAKSPFILWPLIQYLKKNTQCKVVLLAADDVYGSYDFLPFYRKCYLKKYLKKCILAADYMYGISDEMSALYRSRFGISTTTLYKGCDLLDAPKQYLNQPLKLVYAGNLLWGRADTLACLAQVLAKINQDGLRAQLEIYTGTTVTEELSQKLNVGRSSKIMGARPYSQIKEILHNADIVLHVESFAPEQIETVRYSFSTKIIDCLQSGAVPVGIGPAETASIAYLKKVPGAVVIDNLDAVTDIMTQILADEEQLHSRINSVRQYALEKHEIENVQRKLREDLASLF